MPCAQGETRTHRGGRNNLSEVRERARSFISKQHEMMDRVYFSSTLIYHSLTYMVLTELLSVPLLQNLLTLLRWMDWGVHGTHALNPWSGWPRQPSHCPSEPQSVIISYICVKNHFLYMCIFKVVFDGRVNMILVTSSWLAVEVFNWNFWRKFKEGLFEGMRKRFWSIQAPVIMGPLLLLDVWKGTVQEVDQKEIF